MVALTRLPQAPSLPYPEDGDLERQLCDFILRGIGLSEAAIARHLDPKSSHHVQAMIAESA